MHPLWIDGLVVVAYFAVIIFIGLRAGRGERSMESFAMGDRNIPWWAVMASILAAEISAATFLGAPGEGYATRNFTYAQLALGTIIARFIIAGVFIKPFYDFRVVSIYQYLSLRFGAQTRNASSALFLVTRALASGTRLYVAAIVIVMTYEQITGVSLTPFQQVGVYSVALLLITSITALYTAVGGIKAVVWTDLIQATLMFGSLGFAIWTLLDRVPDGWPGVLAVLNGPKDFAIVDLGITPGAGFWGNVRSILESEYTLWAALIGSTFTTMATHGTDQDMVQRMLTAKNHQRSRFSLILSGLADLPLVLCFLLVGMLLWVHYQQPGKDAPFAFFIVNELPPGVRGILFAGIFATAMGSLSTALNALATSFTEDWYKTHIRPQASDAQILRAARISTVVFSVILVLIGAGTAYAKIVLQARIIPIVLGIFGYTYGSLLGVFLVGLLTRRRGSERGNLWAMLAGFIAVALLSGLHNDLWALSHPTSALGVPLPLLWKPFWLPTIEFPWRIAFGTVVTASVALLFKTPESQLALAEAHLASVRERNEREDAAGAPH
ncbi:MAG: Na+/proline symporter [Verrucomicrobia bacterium]|nr:MAG: Na+/proline symporter [Verrucomicrobiota bacterium]